MPPTKNQSSNSDSKPLSFAEIVAKLTVHGITPQQIAKMTKKQLYYAIEAINEDIKQNARFAGWNVEENSGDKIATLQDVLGFGL